jgi:ABC-type dipeptide/oligopeptide/nickel transport system permease subunit
MGKKLTKISDAFKSGFTGIMGLFKETSATSLMRFMSFFMFFFSLFEIQYIMVNYGTALEANHIFLIGILLTFSFFPKVAQKVIEKKYGVLEKEIEAKKTTSNSPIGHVI